MKVIVASMPKCGTKTLAAALRELGYTVYDAMEHYQYHTNEWEKIYAGGATTQDIYRMYKDVDAVTDVPAMGIWEEISRAFPDAKIILTERENDEVWLKSFMKQMEYAQNWVPYLATKISSLNTQFVRLATTAVRTFSGCDANTYFSLPTPKMIPNDMLFKNWYRRHNAHVKQAAPKGQLLVFDMKSGWGPLCEFLGKPVPSTPFPHRNKNGTLFESELNNHPYILRLRRHWNISAAVWAACLSYIGYRAYTKSFGETYIVQYGVFGLDRVLEYFGYIRY